MIRVLIPSMPTADELLPFLREIDERKVYVNGGPLVRRLEAEDRGLDESPCTVVSNGTLSLELALRAMNLPQGCGVLVPAVTYVASAQAIVNAGSCR
jgi:dTDP-4-amino-4,6-dideoxygalactose transaminase